jgi:hypothetical protein
MHRFLIAASIAAAATGVGAQASPYAGHQSRQIKALSPQEVSDLLAGQGRQIRQYAVLRGYAGTPPSGAADTQPRHQQKH